MFTVDLLGILRQCVGMLISVERTQKEFAESDQVHLITLLTQLHTKLVGMFEKYLEEQLKFIEEARQKTKRKGVLPFMRIFPVSYPVPLGCSSRTFSLFAGHTILHNIGCFLHT